MACVDSGFRVCGVQGLRVADFECCAVRYFVRLLCGIRGLWLTRGGDRNHTQATAYLNAETAVEKIVRDWRLDGDGGGVVTLM
jgi:hypothetical protein